MISDAEKSEKFAAKSEKYQQKTEVFQNKIDKNVMKTEKYDRKVHGKPKTVYTVSLSRDYNPSDERGYSFSAHLDKTVMSRAEYNQNKPRGLLHTLDSRIQTSNIGLVLPVVTRNSEPLINNGAINMNYRKVNVQLRNFTPPKMVMSAASGIKETALTAESFALKAGDGVKSFGKTTAKTSYSALRMKISNEAFKLSQENTGLKGAMAVHTALTTTASVLNRTFSAKKEYHIKKKGIRLENKHERLQRKLDKFEMKSIVAKEKADFFGQKSDISVKGYDRAAKKKAWKKVFDGAEGRNYLKKPEVKSMKLTSKTDTLALKEYKQAKKIYKTKRVKEVSFNELTGKKQVASKRVVDYSRKKMPRVKKPHGLIFNSVGAGVGVIGNKAMMSLSNADDVGAQAVGKGLRALNELSRFAKQQNAIRSKLKFEKKAKAAELRLNKLHNKLQFEKEKAPVANSKKNLKKAQKRQLRKRRNQESFKQRMKNTAKNLMNKAQDVIKNLLKKKNSLIVLGLGSALLIFILPIMPILLLGGGGSGVSSGLIGTSVYPVDNKILTETLFAYNSSLESYYSQAQAAVGNMKGSTPSPPKNMTGTSYVFGGLKASFQYDIFKLSSYLSAKYRNDWKGAENELRQLVFRLYKLECRNEDVSVSHTQCQIGVDKDKNPIYGTITFYTYRYCIYPTDYSIDDYISEQLASMGTPREDEGGKTEYELHYNMLMQSDGGHQQLGTPLPDLMYWTSNGSASVYEKLSPIQPKTIDNCIGISCEAGFPVAAGGDGIIQRISGNAITIKYGDDFVVTYYGDVSSTQYTTGSKVKYGDQLFITGSPPDSESSYRLQISVYDNSVNSYVNPAFIMEGYPGQLEENRKRREEEIQQPTEQPS